MMWPFPRYLLMTMLRFQLERFEVGLDQTRLAYNMTTAVSNRSLAGELAYSDPRSWHCNVGPDASKLILFYRRSLSFDYYYLICYIIYKLVPSIIVI